MIAIHWHSIITTKLIDLRTWGSGENENIPVKFSNDQIKEKIKSIISNVYIIIHEKKAKWKNSIEDKTRLYRLTESSKY